MSRKLDRLIERVRAGEEQAVHALVDELRKPARHAVLLELFTAAHPLLRRAAVEAAVGREDAELLDQVTRCAQDRDDGVRAAIADGLLNHPEWSLEDVCTAFLTDGSAFVRRLAARAAAYRPSTHAVLLERLGDEFDWQTRQGIAESLGSAEPADALPVLVKCVAVDADPDVARAAAAAAENHVVALDGYPDDLARPGSQALAQALRRVMSFGEKRFPRLAAWLEERSVTDVDAEFLGSFGADLTAESERGQLPRAHGLDESCQVVIRHVTRVGGPRSLVLLGPSGAGKTALVHEMVHRLRDQRGGPWRVVRVSAADLMAGTLYLGEWQTKIRDLVNAAKAPKRVVIYVPNLEELAEAGRSSQSSLNIATMLAPHIESGAIAVVGESTAEAFAVGLGRNASLRRLFTPVDLRESDPDETSEILAHVRDEYGAPMEDADVDRLMELADFYLGGTAQPGRAVGLLRNVLENRDEEGAPVTTSDVLATLSTSTGIPIALLDDDVALDPDEVATFFESRVMGQPEALETVQDLVMLIKAGLTDPGKPFGVLFFVGPTGVGKTELARALAEYLFGDPARLTRLDMSEFATYDAFERLIGQGDKPGLLTRPVRDQPFSVLLLDEIEKAHTNVFDLCLQVFDAGRLTESNGRTTDFRHTIIILTSNVGSVVPTDAGVGFSNVPAPPPDRDATLRRLGHFFRPEFLNRLDRIVNFRPLDEETAERIARRELARVLERSGIKRRGLAVDVEPAVLALLLRQGYSPAFGARPLKRTVERLVLLPVARAIAQGAVPSGSVLGLVARGDRVKARIVPPEDAAEAVSGTEIEEESASGPFAASVEAVRGGAKELADRVETLREQAQPLVERKAALLERTRAPGFWDEPSAARQDLDAIHRLEGVLEPFGRLELDSAQLLGRARRLRPSSPRPTRLASWLAELQQRCERLSVLLRRTQGADLGDALVTVTLVTTQGALLDGVERLAGMYAGLATRLEFDCEVLDDRRGGEPPEDTITLHVGGVGAYGLLRTETGLHQLLRVHKGDRKREDREVVRVAVLPAPDGSTEFGRDELRFESRPLKGVRGRLVEKPKREVTLMHVPTMTSARAWTGLPRKKAQELLEMLVRARVESADVESPEHHMVRRYVLGPAPLVRDHASGRTTGNLDRVLGGELDLFLTGAGA